MINLVMQLLKGVEVEDFKDLEDSTVHLSQIFLKISSVILVEAAPQEGQVIEETT